MPFARPTLTQLIDRATQDVESAELQDAQGNTIVGQILRKSTLRVLSKMEAGYAFEQYGYLDWIAKQSTPWGATDENSLAWGGLKGVAPKPAVPTVGTAAFTGAANTPLPALTAVSSPGGVLYQTTSEVLAGSDGRVVVPVQALVPGIAGNLAAGSAVSLASPVSGINAAGTWSATVSPGADAETMDAFKARYLAVYRQPPQGGSLSDYLEWAGAVPGVTRAWCSPTPAPGQVIVWVMFDDARALQGGFPQGSNGLAAGDSRGAAATGDQLVVANSIRLVQPVTAMVTVSAPTPGPVAFTISNLGTANTTANRVAITAALVGMFRRLGDPIGGTIYPNAWDAAVAATGVPAFTVVSPAAPLTGTLGVLPILGIPTFNT